ncbi:hypothetical protein [Vibrio vulnificus]|uniref:hypothetical protein n=1 Tax=Vibrio vulnificus TaxID=672 RepID=UPI0018DE260F|nr:hypothetical protein [Vibrio vulnificus]
MTKQYEMKRAQSIVLDTQEAVDKVNAACDLMEELTGAKWSVNKWFKKNAVVAAKKED